jgi:hypothetical protein
MLGGNFIMPSSCTDTKAGEDARVEASDSAAEVSPCTGGPTEEVLRLLPGRSMLWFWPGVGAFEYQSPIWSDSCEESALPTQEGLALGSCGSGVAGHSRTEPSGSCVGLVAGATALAAAFPCFSSAAQAPQMS